MSQIDALWSASSKRQEREMRLRMTENFQATFDANMIIAKAQAGDRGTAETPWYARAPKSKGRGLTGEALEQAVAMMALQFPDRVN